MKTALHELAQLQIVKACNQLGMQAQMEYVGNGWKADVLIQYNCKQYAFKIIGHQ